MTVSETPREEEKAGTQAPCLLGGDNKAMLAPHFPGFCIQGKQKQVHNPAILLARSLSLEQACTPPHSNVYVHFNKFCTFMLAVLSAFESFLEK